MIVPMDSVAVDFDTDKARAFLHDKAARRQRDLHERFEQAWAKFRAIVDMLIAQYDPKRIWQWGSLLREEHFSEISDIDIAVEGVPSAEAFFAMFGDADALTRFPLDLVEIDKIRGMHADGIRERGRFVYERKE